VLRELVILQISIKRFHETFLRSMAKKQSPGGFVYSTNPSFQPPREEEQEATLPQGQQKLRLRLEKRNGKPTTVIAGFIGPDGDLEALGKKLKTKAGTGGSAKDGLIIIQGDVREKCIAWLKELGFKDTK
jgi:translation initiation factor 1